MKRIIKAITGLYKRFIHNESITIDNELEHIQRSVRAYNSTIDMIVSHNAKLLNGE